METISRNEWDEVKSILLDIREKVSKLVDEAGKELLTPREVCEKLKISKNTYQRYINDKIFTQVRLGNKNSRVYVRRSEIEDLIEKGRI